jgi:ABC-type multidrug transport system fused ATPase/permease subunit
LTAAFIVRDAGGIVEMGSHHELPALGGLYAELHGAQFNA